ncbi:MAG: WYL domain-containing protein [Xanthomonadaceae bacterium]|nr:WYL domain-containing protein [Xanthomonadaceae bacterium]
MNDTSLRYLEMLKQIPRLPNGITATDLHRRLQSLGHAIDKRSIERDLNKLSGMFALTSSEGRPALWSWAREADLTYLPALNPATALMLELAYRHLDSLLPRDALVALEPLFKSARKVLDETVQTGLARWSDKVAAVPENQPLMPASVSASVHEAVHQALLTEMRLEISYRAAGQERPKRYPINPLGLVSRGGSYYVVATARDYPEPRNFAMHRMASATLLDEPATKPTGFNLQRYIADHGFELPLGGDLNLELRVSPWMASYLDERKLSPDQTLTPIRGREEQRLNATVANTEQLRWWLRSFGTAVEVLRPLTLRREMAAEVTELAKTYRVRI